MQRRPLFHYIILNIGYCFIFHQVVMIIWSTKIIKIRKRKMGDLKTHSPSHKLHNNDWEKRGGGGADGGWGWGLGVGVIV